MTKILNVFNKINSLRERYYKASIGKDALIKLISETEVADQVYNSNAIENSTLSLEETEKILLQIDLDRFISQREIFEAKNLARVVSYINQKAKEQELTLEVIISLHQMLIANIRDEVAGRFRKDNEFVRVADHIAPNPKEVPQRLEKMLAEYNAASHENIIKRIDAEMIGRLADDSQNLYPLLEVVALAGDGNYCEIGVLHGGSLCAVALLKKELGHLSTCYGIDPVDGYYPGKPFHKAVDPISKVPVTLETVNRNIKHFELDNVEVIKALSHPFPIDKRFAVTYIDGDHWGQGPWLDWQSVREITRKFVVFDNCDQIHPDVITACKKAVKDDNWELHKQTGIAFILRRVDRD